MASPKTYRLLAGDIGGTNARLVLYEAPAGTVSVATDFTRHRVVAQMYYKNNEFHSFTEVLCAFTSLPEVAAAPIDAACLATAGPVADNRINFTNREGWIIDGRSIREEFGIPAVQLVNDFIAAGYGLLGLDESEVITLQEGETRAQFQSGAADLSPASAAAAAAAAGQPAPPPVPLAPKALVGAGTGLGECFLAPDSDGSYRAWPSEGGHVEFAPRDELEEELLHYLQARLNRPDGHGSGGAGGDGDEHYRARVSVERVVSGRGLENIYEFLRWKFPGEVDRKFDAEYDRSKERGRLMGAEKYNYSLFRQALEIMMGIYGGEVGNVALKFLPLSGLYVAGGIAPKNIEFIRGPHSTFMARLLDKGRVTSILSSIPIYVVMKEDLGLRGAHIVAVRMVASLDHDAAGVADDVDDPNMRIKDPATSVAASSRAVDRSYAQLIRGAIVDYPLAYAAITSLTAAATASMIFVGGRLATQIRARPVGNV